MVLCRRFISIYHLTTERVKVLWNRCPPSIRGLEAAKPPRVPVSRKYQIFTALPVFHASVVA